MTDIHEQTRFHTYSNNEVIIEKLLGEGGQGRVYLAAYRGEKKAVKIYSKSVCNDSEEQRRKLQQFVMMGSPDGRFLWPVDVICDDNVFGFVMDLVPPEYYRIDSILCGRARFSSFRAAVTAAIEITAAMSCLHSRGMFYPDISTANFLVDPNDGKVRICDADQIARFGEPCNTMWTPRFAAPEIICRELEPSVQSGRYSLAVIIFLLLTRAHPLEGKRSLCTLLTPELEQQIYGIDPVFILDPDDDRNRPVAGVHTPIEKIWTELPAYMKEMFIRQFSREVLLHPEKRATEGEWLDLLMRFRSEIVPCQACKGESFGYGPDKSSPVCSCCGAPLRIHRFASSKRINYKIPLIPGREICRLQIAACSIDKADAPAFRIWIHPEEPKQLVLINRSGEDVYLLTLGSERRLVKPNHAFVAAPGVKVDACGGLLEVESF